MQEFLSAVFLGMPVERWLVALAFAVGGYLAGKIASVVSTRILKRVAAKTSNRVDDIVLAVTERPLVFILFTAGLWLGIDSLDLAQETTRWVDKLFYVLVVLVGAWVLSRIVDAVIEEYLVPYVAKSEGNLDDQLLPIVRKGLKLVIWVLAILVGLNNAGYDVGALLAGLGIGGVAVALAAKDTLSNLFGSVAVFIDKPFGINDRIKVAGFDGTVTEIGLRTSRLKTLDNRVVTIPNALFAAGAIENVSSEPSTKVASTLELSLDNPVEAVERALSILKEAAASSPGLEGEPVASFSGFGDGSIKVTFIVFVRKDADYFGTLCALNLEVLRRLKEAKVELARRPALAAPAR